MEQELNRKTMVIGHRNPDTDSICSAICYANLKQAVTGEEYMPARAGHVNGETQFVLDYFGAEEPQLVEDVRTQVRDIEIRKTKGADNISLKRAWNIMQENNVVTIPSVREDGTLEGLITVGDITKTYMNIYDSSILSKANTQYSNIIETLEAELIIGSAEAYFDQGKVLIAAANPDLMEFYIEPHDLVILGNRYESQLCAIEMGADCIIVCEGAAVSMTIKKIAQERGCTIIATTYDTYTAARLINQSMPISYFMTREHLITFNSDDYIDEIREVMASKRHRDFPILDKDGYYLETTPGRRSTGSFKPSSSNSSISWWNAFPASCRAPCPSQISSVVSVNIFVSIKNIISKPLFSSAFSINASIRPFNLSSSPPFKEVICPTPMVTLPEVKRLKS